MCVTDCSILLGVDEIVMVVESCPESGQLVAFWDDPSGNGGITTQAADLRELQAQVDDAVRCHFESSSMPKTVRYHFVSDPVLSTTGNFRATSRANHCVALWYGLDLYGWDRLVLT